MIAEFIDPAILGFILVGVMLFAIFVGFPISSSSLEVEHKLKRKIKIIKYVFFNFIGFSSQIKVLVA